MDGVQDKIFKMDKLTLEPECCGRVDKVLTLDPPLRE
jgi:hypothetical protein